MISTERRPPTPELRALVASALGRQPVRWHAPSTGLSPAQRFVVSFADGSGAFVKAAVDDTTEAWLRTEHQVLSVLADGLGPRPLAWIGEGVRPVLVTEDLSGARWPADHLPVAWQSRELDFLFEALRRLAEVAPPLTLPAAEAGFEPQWPSILGEADDFLALGLCSGTWLREAIDGLVEAEGNVPLPGDSLVHNDVRSDNLCIIDERVVLVDWGGALRGNRQQDLAAALSTLPLEGGPDPFDVMPEGGAWAAYLAGLSARRAYREREAPPWFRKVLQRIAVICLSWAARSLALPTWSGSDWRQIR